MKQIVSFGVSSAATRKTKLLLPSCLLDSLEHASMKQAVSTVLSIGASACRSRDGQVSFLASTSVIRRSWRALLSSNPPLTPDIRRLRRAAPRATLYTKDCWVCSHSAIPLRTLWTPNADLHSVRRVQLHCRINEMGLRGWTRNARQQLMEGLLCGEGVVRQRRSGE